MTTTHRHAAPWTLRRFMSCLFGSPRSRVKFTFTPDLLPGRDAAARHLFGESCNWDDAAMADYDRSPRLRGGWLAEADRRIAHAKSADRHVAAFHGIKDSDWIHLPAIVQRDHREAFYQARGL